MKTVAILLMVCLTLCSCGAAEPAAAKPEIMMDIASPSLSSEQSEQEPEPEPEPEEPESGPVVYEPEPGMSLEDTVLAYFEQQYLAYLSLEDADCTAIIDMSREVNLKMLQWIRLLNQRRRLLAQSGLCYVDTEYKSYEIVFDEQPEDDRMDRWSKWMDMSDHAAVHFHIEGEDGAAYPPFMAVNSQHTMFMKNDGGVWKIVQHYFPGALRKYIRTDEIEEPGDDAMLERLMEEFDASGTADPEPIPDGFDEYDPEAAVAYAMLYTEEKNPEFYDIGDWTGNCANFISQCVWAGFGEGHMDSLWRGGSSGSPAWENVNHFWEYITAGTGLCGDEFTGAGALREGDIVQMRSASDPEDNRYTHTMIVVDGEKLILAQNTPACFVYYSDLANTELRFIRPAYAVNNK